MGGHGIGRNSDEFGVLSCCHHFPHGEARVSSVGLNVSGEVCWCVFDLCGYFTVFGVFFVGGFVTTLMVQAAKGMLVVVDFYADWCGPW